MSDYYDPYVGFGGDDRRWLKSQFHMHNSRVVDGRHVEDIEGMDAVFQEYKDCDYQIVAAATHNDYVETSHLDERIGIRSFGNEEYVDYDGILLVGISRAHRGEPQDVIDACVAEGGFAVICPPNQNPMLNEVSDMIPTLLTKEMSRSLTGAVGVEIYTGCLSRRQWDGVGFGLSLATDYWDEALSSGRRLWGFATDDSHQGYEVNVGWTEILAAADDFATVKASVERGALTASRGMRLYGWKFDGRRLEVEADLPYLRAFEAEYSFIGDGGAVLHRETGRTASYELSGDERYVRVEARSGDGSVIWTQPLLRADAFEVSA